MEKFTQNELAHFALGLLRNDFNSNETIYNKFRSNINRKLQSLSPTQLTDAELERLGLKFSSDILDKVQRIEVQHFESKISRELINESNSVGIDLKANKSYFDKMVTDLIKHIIKLQYDAFKKMKKKK